MRNELREGYNTNIKLYLIMLNGRYFVCKTTDYSMHFVVKLLIMKAYCKQGEL